MVVLEGGYSIDAISKSAHAVIKTLKVSQDDEEGLSSLLGELS